jgi:hypothetical protein
MLAASAVALAATADPASGQIGAIGVVPGGSAAGRGGVVGTPVFTNSAIMLPKSRWTISGFGVFSTISFEQYDPFLNLFYEREITSSSLVATAAYGLSEKTMLGAQLRPVNNREVTDRALGQSQSFSQSGMGDAVVFVKQQFSRSSNGRTSVAGVASLSLPIGSYEDGFGSSGTVLGGALAVSHQSGRTTWHGEGNVILPTDDADGDAVLGLNGAGVFSISPRAWLSAELLTIIANGEWVALGAPAARFAVGQKAFIDAGLAFKLATSVSGGTWPTTVILGVVFVP